MTLHADFYCNPCGLLLQSIGTKLQSMKTKLQFLQLRNIIYDGIVWYINFRDFQYALSFFVKPTWVWMMFLSCFRLQLSKKGWFYHRKVSTEGILLPYTPFVLVPQLIPARIVCRAPTYACSMSMLIQKLPRVLFSYHESTKYAVSCQGWLVSLMGGTQIPTLRMLTTSKVGQVCYLILLVFAL